LYGIYEAVVYSIPKYENNKEKTETENVKFELDIRDQQTIKGLSTAAPNYPIGKTLSQDNGRSKVMNT